jgi:hypothetical protein
MPTPFTLQMTADIWTTNVDQKLQILEQLLVLFNPSMEIQTNSNFIDWTSLSLVELTGMVFSSRSIPQGLEQDIDVATLNFSSPIWLTTPAKVKKLGIITQIITNMFADSPGTIAGGAYPDTESIDYFSSRVSISVGRHTLGNLGVLLLNNPQTGFYSAKLMREGESTQKTDTVQPGARASATRIVVNGTPVTNSRGQQTLSLAGLAETPPAGTLIRIGGSFYTVESYAGDLANLTVTLTEPLGEDLAEGSNVFVQFPSTNPNDIVVPVKQGSEINWNSILDLYPGKFAAGLSTIRFQKPDGSEIVGQITLDPIDDAHMVVTFEDQDTLPSNTLIVDMNGNLPSGKIDAIIDPTSYNPRPDDQNNPDGLGWPETDIRYLILEDIVGGEGGREWAELDSDGNPLTDRQGVRAWTNRDLSAFTAKANDIIQWDGVKWNRILKSDETAGLVYITNSRTGVQYAWDGEAWMKSYEGVYGPGKWRLVL